MSKFTKISIVAEGIVIQNGQHLDLIRLTTEELTDLGMRCALQARQNVEAMKKAASQPN